MDSIADGGTGGEAATPITGASTDKEDEDAGMGLLADGRRRREPQTITRPVPALIRPAQTPTSGTLTRPWIRARSTTSRRGWHSTLAPSVRPRRLPRVGHGRRRARGDLGWHATGGEARPPRGGNRRGLTAVGSPSPSETMVTFGEGRSDTRSAE